MNQSDERVQAVIQRLSSVIDPETGMDVMRMGLVEDLQVDADGRASLVFRPSSPLCPIAVPLALSIMQAIDEVEGVTASRMNVVDYTGADELNAILEALFS